MFQFDCKDTTINLNSQIFPSTLLGVGFWQRSGCLIIIHSYAYKYLVP